MGFGAETRRSPRGLGRSEPQKKPFKKVGDLAPYLLKGFLGRPGPPRTRKCPIFHQITKPPSLKPPSGSRRHAAGRGPFKGPRGPFKGPRGPFKGPRGPLKGPRASTFAGRPTRETKRKPGAERPLRRCAAAPLSKWARPKKGGEKGVKITIFGPFFLGFSPEIDPRTPLKRVQLKKWCRIRTKSAPETNSKAISLWARGGYVLGRSHKRTPGSF